MSQTIKIDQLADTVMKGMEEYAKLAADDLKKDVKKAGDTVKKADRGYGSEEDREVFQELGGEEDAGNFGFHPGRGALQAVPADASFGVWPCEEGWRKDKGFSTHRAGRTGWHRAADKGYRERFTEGG